ncbi:MAG: hypothetical protein RIS64_2005 [Bacteroidota bacterium]|jgi:hypothetical protein
MSTYLNKAQDALSIFNPIISLSHDGGNKFIDLVVKDFFKEKGGIQQFDVLDTTKLKTEKEFKSDISFVNDYIYKIITCSMARKNDSHEIEFKPKYVVTFDKSLTPYPYEYIKNGHYQVIYYGKLSLGDKPLLYYIFIDLQQLIHYIKSIA